LIVVILCNLLYNYFVKNKTILKGLERLEGFNGDSNAIDLLNKYKSNDVQLTGDSSSSDIELSINPWTTKLHNMQTTQQVKPIGLYKPHLVINGEKYAKLGDMISLNSDFSAPTAKEFALLVKKIGSDYKAPVNYNLVLNFGNSNIPSFYYQYDRFLNSQNNLSLIMNNLNNCLSSISNLNNLIINNQNSILTIIKNIISSQVTLHIGTANPISLSSIMNMPVNNVSDGLLQIPISSTTNIILPFGIDALISTPDNQYDINCGTNFDINFDINNTISINNLVSQIQPNSPFRNFTNNNFIITTTSPINIFALINPNNIITYLQKLCNDILTIFGQTTISSDFIAYLNLADSIDGVNSILSAISTLHTNTNVLSGLTTPAPTVSVTANSVNIFARNSIINAYANTNSNTLLGGILNIIINKTKTFNYPSISFTPNNLVYNDVSNNTSVIGIINGITDATGITINNFTNTIMDNISFNINSNSPEIANITLHVIPHLSQLFEFQTALTNGNIDYFPLQIYEPVAPQNYTALGHVFCNKVSDFYKISTAGNMACVPSQCVREIRDWQASDKVFEYNHAGIYWALFKNPYIGTFIAVTQPQMPSGKVCKVIACVAKCTAVDELKKADTCARKYYQMNKSIMSDVTTAPDLAASAEEEIYLQKIKTQSDNIAKLKQRAQQMQINIDKADIINKEMNKSTLQDYVDTQKRNIDLVVKKLEKDNNKIKTDIHIPVNALNQIINIINDLNTLNSQQKQDIINKIINNATQLSDNIITSGQYNANLNKILQSCPQYELTGLVKKDLVSNVCYGCN
jgi:hypothetical protein